MGVNVKPLTHWIIYRGYRVRFTQRSPAAVTGWLYTDAGTIAFSYDPQHRVVELPDETVHINDYGWEVEAS